MKEEPCGIANGVTLEEITSRQTATKQEVLQLQASSAMFLEPIQKNTQVNIFFICLEYKHYNI